ncbi:hypothetical protein VTI28DRAFT_8116 [Corynascus sepedonium]
MPFDHLKNEIANGITKGSSCSVLKDGGNDNWVVVQRIHYRFVPDQTYLLHILQMRYGKGNFYVEAAWFGDY